MKRTVLPSLAAAALATAALAATIDCKMTKAKTCEKRTQIGPVLRVWERSPYFHGGTYVMVSSKEQKEQLQALFKALYTPDQAPKVYTPEEEPFIEKSQTKTPTDSDRREI